MRGQIGEADPGAVTRAVDKGGARITQINDFTRGEINKLVGQAIQDGLSPREAGDLVESWSGFDEYRAERIARTEMMFAYNQAALNSYADYGVSLVEAVDGDDDDECAERDGQIFTLDEAEGIEDHPNGTLDWIPIAPDKMVAQAAPLVEVTEQVQDLYQPAKQGGIVDLAELLIKVDRREKTFRLAGEELHGDQYLRQLYKEQGFDGLPEVLSSSDIDAYVAKGEKDLYRGMHRGADEFRGGEYFPGEGIYGNGTYTAEAGDLMPGRPFNIGQAVARNYSGKDGQIIRMTLRSDARTIDYYEAKEGARKAAIEAEERVHAIGQEMADELARIDSDARYRYSSLKNLPTVDAEAIMKEKDAAKTAVRERADESIQKIKQEARVLSDPGRWAAYHGYDAIDVSQTGDPYWVILNRTAVRVQRGNFEWTA